MSYNVHEAFCLDSFQSQLLFWDDFEGDSLKDLWRAIGVGAGSAAVVDSQDGGIVRITTGAITTNDYKIDWGAIRSLHVNKKVTLETRFKLNAVTQEYVRTILNFDGTNYIRFFLDPTVAAVNWDIQCVNGGVSTSQDSGILADTDYHIYRIECFPVGEIHFYIDGVETANSPITTNIPDDAADYLEPVIHLTTREDVAKSMDVDYVYVRQDR